jgi:hypothetical protein
MSHEAVFAQLKELATTVPNLARQPINMADPDILIWLGRLSAAVDGLGDSTDIVSLNFAIDRLPTLAQGSSASKIMVILYRALARAEAKVPSAGRGSFIAAGSPFDALTTIGSLFAEAKGSIRIIDPYLDEKVLTTFAAMASENVAIELLADKATVKGSLKPAAAAWAAQYGALRPLASRLAAPKSLHDRLIIIDGTTVWDLSQSIKDFAARSPASASKADAELAAMKIGAYDTLWQGASPL